MDAINNGIINGSIDHGSRFKLPGPTAKAHVILQPFAATRLLVLVGEPAGKRSVRLSPIIKDVSIMSFSHSAFRSLKWSFCLKPLFRRPIRFFNAFEKRSFPFQSLASSKLTKNAKLLQHTTTQALQYI